MAKSMKDLLADAKTRVETVAPTEAQAAVQRGALILDVREAAELDSDGAIPGAVHIPRGLLESKADPDTGKADNALTARRGGDDTVHVLCASGARATLAADTLRQMGYRAAVIDGGMAAWAETGLPIEGRKGNDA